MIENYSGNEHRILEIFLKRVYMHERSNPGSPHCGPGDSAAINHATETVAPLLFFMDWKCHQLRFNDTQT